MASRYAQQAEQKRIALRIEPDGALPEIQVDEARMIQVLSNLVANALRHTPPQGAVRLSAQRAGDRVRFAVTDTGAGIRAEDLARVFERFLSRRRLSLRQQRRSGLGLAIAKALVEAHSGAIWAESEPKRGATLIVELPI